LEFCDGGGAKNRMMPLPNRQRSFDDMSIYLDTILALNGRNCYSNIALYMHTVMTCDKKSITNKCINYFDFCGSWYHFI